MTNPAWLLPLAPTAGAGTGNTFTNVATNVLCWRVWFGDRSCVLVDATSEDEARASAASISRRNGYAPHELGGRIASVECLDR